MDINKPIVLYLTMETIEEVHIVLMGIGKTTKIPITCKID